MALRRVAPLALAGALLNIFLTGPRLLAQRALEYEVKAAYLYNIVNFVTWPPDAFTGPSDPLHVCVYGMDPFGRALDTAMQNGTSNGRPVQVIRAADANALSTCEVAFLPGTNTDRIDQGVRLTAQRPVLTVGEAPDFLRRGGMIAFVVDGGRVRFDINLQAASARGLTLSSRLLQVARTVTTGKGGAG
jgi:hypothetical protein